MYQVQRAFHGHVVTGFCGAQSNRRKRRFDRVGGAQMLPMHGGKVVKDQQLLAILDQAVDGLGILGFVSFDEAIKRLLRLGVSRRLVDLLQG